MKTFTEKLGEKLADVFSEFGKHNELVSYVTYGVPVAIAGYLQSSLASSDKLRSELSFKDKTGTLMTFSLEAVKKGDAVAFLPSFEIGDAALDYIGSDDITIDQMAYENLGLDLVTNEPEFVECVQQATKCRVYNNGEWAAANKDLVDDVNIHGLRFEEDADPAYCVASMIYTIIEILCKVKDQSQEVSYEIPGFGKFNVAPVKNGYDVTLTIDKEFKSNCKSDKLAEDIANR